MIGSLRGRILEVHAAFFLIEVGAVGYAVKATGGTLSALKTGEESFVYIHEQIREDAHDLYGFATRSELELFERLLNVSGVGPKVALTLLSLGSPEAVRRAILQGDLALLTSLPGVGTKTAQKIVLELKGQLVEAVDVSPKDAEAIDALVSLGYSTTQARDAINAVSSEHANVSDVVREALKYLGK